MNNKKWIIFAVLTTILVLLTAGQSYKEDISDFLPLENEQQEAFMEYQNTSSARRIYVIFQSADNDCQPAVDLFSERLERADTAQTINYLQGDDPEVVQEAMNTIYAQMPYLLTADDYARIDSITETPDFMDRQLENDKQMLMLPSGGMAAMQIQHDPLNLFASVLARQKPTNLANSSMLLIDSPFGASETEHNAALVAMLQQVCDSVGNAYPDVSIHLTGGPVIAVGNAQQIKKDSIISITFAAILILLLLWLVFRNVRNMMLIAVSIAWGWLFAMGCLTLVHNDVSIIVIGISSVILGIAVRADGTQRDKDAAGGWQRHHRRGVSGAGAATVSGIARLGAFQRIPARRHHHLRTRMVTTHGAKGGRPQPSLRATLRPSGQRTISHQTSAISH